MWFVGVSDLSARGKNAMLITLYFRILCCPWRHIVIITNLILVLFVDYVFNYFMLLRNVDYWSESGTSVTSIGTTK